MWVQVAPRPTVPKTVPLGRVGPLKLNEHRYLKWNKSGVMVVGYAEAAANSVTIVPPVVVRPKL